MSYAKHYHPYFFSVDLKKNIQSLRIILIFITIPLIFSIYYQQDIGPWMPPQYTPPLFLVIRMQQNTAAKMAVTRPPMMTSPPASDLSDLCLPRRRISGASAAVNSSPISDDSDSDELDVGGGGTTVGTEPRED